MVEALHGKQTILEGIHTVVAYEYEDAAERTGASGFDSRDIGKVALQQDTESLWYITSVDGYGAPTWKAFGGGVTDHGDLTGLLDDDHPQYYRVDGYRPLTGDMDAGGYGITGLVNPSSPQDAATKWYVDAQIVAGGNLSVTLAAGNTTDGYDIEITDGDAIVGQDGFDLVLQTTSGGDIVLDSSGIIDASNNLISNLSTPVDAGDAVTKGYVDGYFAGLEHGDLLGLGDDDHTQYILVDGTRDFTGTVGGVTPTNPDHLVTKQYVDGYFAGLEHGDLLGLGDDDHTQYILVDGTRAFTGTVGGVTPTIASHLATKGYVDGYIASTNEWSEVLVNGRASGGTDPLISTGDVLEGETDLNLQSAADGYTIISAGSTEIVRYGLGSLLMQFADSDDARIGFAPSSSAGVDLHITGQSTTTNGAGAGTIYITAGSASTGNTDGGAVEIRGGNATGTGAAGPVKLICAEDFGGSPGGAEGRIEFWGDPTTRYAYFADGFPGYLIWDEAISWVRLYQERSLSGAGAEFHITAQDGPVAGGGTGGNLQLAGGNGYSTSGGGNASLFGGDASGTSGTGGHVYLESGRGGSSTGSSGTIYFTIGDGTTKGDFVYQNSGAAEPTLTIDGTSRGTVTFGKDTTPRINQTARTTTGNGANTTIEAQDAGAGVSNGGHLLLDSGAGFGGGSHGNIGFYQGTNQVVSLIGASAVSSLGTLTWDWQVTPVITQENNGSYPFTIRASGGTTGRDLILAGGDGTGDSDGNVVFYRGISTEMARFANSGSNVTLRFDEAAGNITIEQGSQAGAGTGSMTVQAQNANSGSGGSLTLNAGYSTTGTGGNVAISAGSSGASGVKGGNITLTAGTGALSTPGEGGDIILNSGSGAGGSPSSLDGYVRFQVDSVEVVTVLPSLAMSLNGFPIHDVQDPILPQDAATKRYVDGYFESQNEWSEVLANGNTSGGTDPVISTGDVIRGETAITVRGANGTTGSAATLQGGIGTTGSGGDVNLQGGSSSSGAGGDVWIKAGNNVSATNPGGSVYIWAGGADGNGGSGDVEIKALIGDGGNGDVRFNLANIEVGSFLGASPGTFQFSTAVTAATITQAQISGSVGNDLTVKAQGSTTQTGGNLILAGGDGPSNNDGYISFRRGDVPMGRFWNAGTVVYLEFAKEAGNKFIQIQSADSGFGSALTVFGQTAPSGGGGLYLNAGNCSGASGSGGLVNISGGLSTGSADGPNVTIQGGTGGATGAGGHVILNGGSGAGGSPSSNDGDVKFQIDNVDVARFVGTAPGTLEFDDAITPIINQASIASAGADFSITAQESTAGEGGNLVLSAGAGTTSDGYVIIRRGSTEVARWDNGGSERLLLQTEVVEFGSSVSAPRIEQENKTGAAGETMSITAQSSNQWGGHLNLTAGSNTNPGATAGYPGGTVTITGGSGDSVGTGGHIKLVSGEGGSGSPTVYDGDIEFWISSVQVAEFSAQTLALSVLSNPIHDVQDPTLPQDAATKNYVDGYIASSNEWSEILANGNTSGGTDPIISTGDAIYGETALNLLTPNVSSGPSGQIKLETGDSTAGGSASVLVYTGDGYAYSGSISILTGAATEPGSTTGSVEIRSASSAENTGSATISSGVSSGAASGSATIETGNGNTAVGLLTIRGGDCTGSTANGGNVNIDGGNAAGTGRAGGVFVNGGDATTSGRGGHAWFQAGDGYLDGGDILVAAGDGVNDQGGSLTLNCGQGATGGSVDSNAGTGINGTGGTWNLSGGQGSTTGGDVLIKGGTGGIGDGGDLTLQSGVSTSAEDGYIIFRRGVTEVARWNENSFLDVNTNRIIDLQDPVDPQDAVTKNYVDGYFAGLEHHDLLGLGDDDHTQYLLVSGSRAMSGDLDMGTNDITNVGTVDGRDVSADGTTLDNHVANLNNPHQTSFSNLDGYVEDSAAGSTNTGLVLTPDGYGGVQWGTVAGGASLSETWRFSSATADADPGTRRFRLNNATQSSATFMYVSDIADSGVDMGNVLQALRSGDRIYVQELLDSTHYHLVNVTGTPTDATTYHKIPITVEDSGTDLTNNVRCGFILIFSSNQPDTHGSTHLPDNSDGLTVAAPVAVGDANSIGSANSFVRSDHVHALGGAVGGDLDGYLPNPTVVDLTISGEEQGSVLYYSGSNWTQLSPGSDGYILTTHSTGGNPTWESPGLPGLHATTHENGGSDEIDVTGLSGQLADAQPVKVRLNSVGDGYVQPRLNLIEGANIVLTVDDDPGSNEIDITISTGGAVGEANVGANVGGATGQVYRNKTGVTLNFKTFSGSDGIGITNNADTIGIDGYALLPRDGSRPMAGDLDLDGYDLLNPGADTFSTIYGAGTTGSTHGDILYRGSSGWVTLSAGDDGYVLTTHDSGSNPTWEPQTGGSGEANTAANVGGGTGEIFRDKTGVTINLKTVNGSDGINVTNNANTVDLDGYALLPRDGSRPMAGDLDLDGYDILDAGEINGYRTYAASATNPSSPVPADGDRYFNTALGMWMTYDGSRSKWLSEESAYIQFGRNGNTAAGAYFRGIDGQAFSATIGQYAMWAGTIVAGSITVASAVTTTIEFTESGTQRATLGLTAQTAASSTALNGDFSAAGVLGVRNISAGATVDNSQGWFKVKWRV